MVINPHTIVLEAMFAIPVETLTAVSVIADELLSSVTPDTVVVAPDLGAVKLGLSVVIVRKTRLTGTTVRAEELVGQVDGRPAILVDDMISTGATIEAAVRLLLDNGARPDVVVDATHGLFVGEAVERLAKLPLRRLVITDTLGGVETHALPVEAMSIAPLLAAAIGRLHDDEPADVLLGDA